MELGVPRDPARSRFEVFCYVAVAALLGRGGVSVDGGAGAEGREGSGADAVHGEEVAVLAADGAGGLGGGGVEARVSRESDGGGFAAVGCGGELCVGFGGDAG